MAGRNRANRITPALRKADAGQTAPREAAEQESAQSRAEIAAHCASAGTPIERRRWQVLGLLADKAPLAEIVIATGFRPRTIRQIAQRFREAGPATLIDGRQRSAGATPLLSAEQQHELCRILQNSAPDGRAWTGPKVARWIAATTGRLVHRQRGWEYLVRLGRIKDEKR